MSFIVSVSVAQPEPGRERRERDEHRGYVLDQRYHHDHYYPPRGFVVHSLPPGFVTIRHPAGELFFHEGIWYRRRGPDFVVVAPPAGVAIAALPPGFTTVWVGGVPYFYADDVYYVKRPDGYVVADPPNEAQVSTEPPSGGPASGAPSAGSDELFIYPKNQQSPEQQAKDKYECHSWAATQTGFDPTRESGGVPPGQVDQKRADYRRAMGACLEARGYTVK
jgi:hypothetical protein